MQYKTFMLPASGSEQTEENLNVFLWTHRVVSVRTEFVTDEQLSLIVKQKPENLGKLTAIQGIGQTKAEKYGEAVLGILKGQNESGRESV